MISGQTPDGQISSSPLSDRDWDKLIHLLLEQRVVPVIGPDLLCIPWKQSANERLYELWGKELAKSYPSTKMDITTDAADIPLLYWVSDQLSLISEIPVGDLEYQLSTIVGDSKWPIPLPLLQLAEIKDIPLYISITIDHLMEAALRLKRGSSQNIVFSRTGGSSRNDIPGDFSPTNNPLIIQLFGSSCIDPEAFAVTEDDLIEFSWSLIDHSYAPHNLYSYLNNRQLLLLGCDFPDWLDRFFIHALSHDRGAQVAITFVSERCPQGLKAFLDRKKARKPIQCSPVAFVAELYERWLKAKMVISQISQPPNHLTNQEEALSKLKPNKAGSVFISYARDDRAKAIAIRDQLEANNIDTWMDESDLEPGEDFDEAIHENIKNASFFIAIISKSLNLEDSTRPGRYVLKEWRWAENADLERPKNQKFLQALVLDDTSSDDPFIEGPIRERDWTACPNGRLPESFIDFIRKGVRRYRAQ